MTMLQSSRATVAESRYLAWLTIWLALPLTAGAVIVFSTGDPAHNTTAPTGTLANSGWQFQGQWGGYLGTPVAPKYFLSAAHIGGSVGQTFLFGGASYTTTAVFANTNSDLLLWRICGTFTNYASIYSLPNEVGRPVVVVGRGTQRDGEVLVSNGTSNVLKGWFWGGPDGVQRWGTNVVSSIETDPMVGELLKCNFDATGGTDEAQLSVGDSGGGVFIKDGSVWKLAGINYAVDGPYNTSTNGDGFFAALFDQGGLYEGGTSNWTLIPDTPQGEPSAFYSSRVSAQLAWINGVLQSNSAADPPPTLLSAANVAGPYQPAQGATVDPVAKTVTAPLPSATMFFVLQACDRLRITSLKHQGPDVLFSYQ